MSAGLRRAGRAPLDPSLNQLGLESKREFALRLDRGHAASLAFVGIGDGRTGALTARVLRGQAAIVGVADVASPTGELDQHGRALEVAMIQDALDDAGLTIADVDGIAAGGMPTGLAEYLGVHPRYLDGTMVGGSSYELHVEHAAAAIAAGLCEVVVGVYAATPRSDRQPRGGGGLPRPCPDRTRCSSGRCRTACACRWARTRSPRAGTWRSTARRRSSSRRSRSTRAGGPR